MIFSVRLICSLLLTGLFTAIVPAASGQDTWKIHPASTKCNLNETNVFAQGSPIVCLAIHQGTKYNDQFTAAASCTDCTRNGTGQPSAWVVVAVGITKSCSLSVVTNYYGGTITTGVNGVYAQAESKVGGAGYAYPTQMSTNCTGQSVVSGGSPPGETNPC